MMKLFRKNQSKKAIIPVKQHIPYEDHYKEIERRINDLFKDANIREDFQVIDEEYQFASNLKGE